MYLNEVSIFVKTNPELFDIVKKNHRFISRSQYKFTVSRKRMKTGLMRKSIFGMAPLIYNKIPDTIKILNLAQFKKKMATFLIGKCYYTIDSYLNDNF